MQLKSLFIVFSLALPLVGTAQSAVSNPPTNWQHLDKLKDGFMGVSTDRMYDELLKGKPSRTVIVAVIDGGVDPQHEDLKDVMWTNPGEIPGNGKDDDNNGYVDDIHGWNFIGGKDGKNVHEDQLEFTRIVAGYQKKFKNADPSKLSKKEKKEYDKYMEMKETVEKEFAENGQNYSLYSNILDAVTSVVKAIGIENPTAADLDKFKTSDPKLSRAAQVLGSMLAEGATTLEIIEQIEEGVDYFKSKVDGNDLGLDSRTIVGDDYSNPYERYYGNNDVFGGDSQGSMHGTHVSGTIAAKRDNDIGMDGVANNVKIMALRCVPDGDERDKDVANSILYAVDNGASVINMSFGKGYSPYKDAVDKAVKYARKHDVLIVHAAGNDGENNDVASNFPSDKYAKGGLFKPKMAKNWVEVGALSWQGGEDAAAEFSNYGKANVDLFAPGVAIYSTVPDNKYKLLHGTSMAAPVVSGVAATIRSYFPELTAEQVKDVLMSSTVMVKNARVKKPGAGELVPFSDLCVTGGAVNAYEAVKKASAVKGKKKPDNGAGTGAKGSAKKKGQA